MSILEEKKKKRYFRFYRFQVFQRNCILYNKYTNYYQQYSYTIKTCDYVALHSNIELDTIASFGDDDRGREKEKERAKLWKPLCFSFDFHGRGITLDTIYD